MCVSGETRGSTLTYAREHGFGIEVKDFGHWTAVEDPEVREPLVAWYRRELSSVPGPISAHGLAEDLSFGGDDPKVVAVSRERVLAYLEVAAQAGLPRAVFHTTFHHREPQPWYVTHWIERQAAFWREVLAGRTTEVLLENLWDPSPEAFRDAVDAIGLPQVGACLDAGHAHVHSSFSPARWVEVLGPRIGQLHLHDNARVYDQHLVPGGGTIDWGAFAAALRAAGLCLPAVLEIPDNRLPAAVQLLQRL